MRAVNLIPAEQRGGSAVGGGRSEGAAHAMLALLGGIAVLAALYGMAHHQIASRRTQIATVTAQAQRAQTEAARLAPYTSFIALREQRTQAVSQLVDSRFDWAHVFHEFGRVLPSDISISSLTGTVGSTTTALGAPAAPATPAAPAASTSSASASAARPVASPVTSATPPGSVPTFVLTGCASSQPAVAQMLERLRLIDGVGSVTLQSSTKGASAGGGCPTESPVFSVQIAFDALPSAAAAAAAATASAKTVADSAATAPTTTGTSSK
jgi:Tfp pilus assembly protein PilN